MPNRILRAELIDSEPWLELKDNADRLCYCPALIVSVDSLGNYPAGPQRLMKMWRPYGIDTPEKVAQVKVALVDVDLIRLYQVEGKPYLHVPRFRQRLRWLGHLYPMSPWNTPEEYKAVGKRAAAATLPLWTNCGPNGAVRYETGAPPPGSESHK